MKKNKTILIRVDEDSHRQYKELCKEYGLNMSQRFRNFIKEEIKILKDEKINN